MISRTTPKNSEETSVAPDAPSATQNTTADQAGMSSDHEAEHTAGTSSDKPAENQIPQQGDEKPQNRGMGSVNVKKVATNKLKSHPLSTKIYSPQISDAFVKSIEKNGILVPLMVDPNTYEVIAGNSRLAAAKQLGMSKVPVIYFNSSDELEIRKAVLETNSQREKNKEQKIREYLEWLDIEKEAGKRRMATNSQKDAVYNSTQADAGKSRDRAAVKIGMSGLHAERGGQVVNAIDQLKAKGKSEDATKLASKLDRSINAAYKWAIEAGFIVKAKKTAPKPVTQKPSIAAKESVKAAPVTQYLSLESPEAAVAEQENHEHLFTVDSNDAAIKALSSVCKFVGGIKFGKAKEYWRAQYVAQINAITESLVTAGLDFDKAARN